jgi:ubiquinone/menaquinone biosynthesis C-methylase UbiE
MKPIRTIPLYELAPTNGRSADSQAIFYGHPTATALTESLPQNADVIDVGAGISDFGRVIAAARPDVRWTYMDLRYDNPKILAQAQGEQSLRNVSYVRGNVVEWKEIGVEPDSYDQIYCSRLIPHIELEDRELARRALLNMGRLLKSDGSMTILRGFQPLWRDRVLHRPSSITITKQALLDNPEPVLNNAIAAIRIPNIHRWRQIIHNTNATPYYGQAQWRLPDTKGRTRPMRGQIWDSKGAKFVPRMSWRGHAIYAGFVRHILSNSFSETRS